MNRPAPEPLTVVTPQVLVYPHEAPPLPGQPLEVAPGLFWVRMPLPFALDHINLWLLREEGGWTMVDSGINSEQTRSLWDQVFGQPALAGELQRILVTHYHPDHFGLAGYFARRHGVPVWMTAAEYLMSVAVRSEQANWSKEATLEFFRRHGLDEAGRRAVAERDHSYARLVSEPPAAFVRLFDGDVLSLGGRSWEVIVGYGHAPEHAALYCEELGVLISGDMILPRISTNVSVWPAEPDGDPLGMFLSSVARYAQLPEDTLVLPSHGLPFRGLRARAAMLAEHHRLRLGELLEACTEPLTAASAVPVLFRRPMDGQQMFFAMGEAVAHLNHLLHQRILEREQGPDGLLRFHRRVAP